ncbi:GNAT family N-acetyltransferase [Gordonia soli]|uniref:N-acetyltransferase domain-containing protein n=1 Tax=Gordonia soli NBRC 108243 TaxID=1223545 RepID=M0QS11_9ACTN|nr:GNAT family N-acetyltransferase [Gordonia soli]GAC70637.1 hypothetical protein GS4_38_00430 [Gordonia soli NBRC 108243]
MIADDALVQVLPGSVTARYTPDDLAELVVLQRCCWVQEALANDTLDIPALHETIAEVGDWAQAWTTLTVRLGHRLVAAVRGRAMHDSEWEIGRLMVAPDLAGRGVGSVLLGVVESLAPDTTERFTLFTGAQSSRNIRMYERAGYLLAESSPDGSVGVVNLQKSAR